MASEQTLKALKNYDDYIKAKGGIDDAVISEMVKAAEVLIVTEKDHTTGLKLTTKIKWLINNHVQKSTGKSIWDLERYAMYTNQDIPLVNNFYRCLLLESWDRFDSFMYYMERKRPYEKRFYQPRAKTLHIVAEDLQDLEDRKYIFCGISMPSRTGKSTICIFNLAWRGMKRPNSHSAMGGHSGVLAKGFHKELLNLITSEEYCFKEIYDFWNYGHVMLQDKSAEEFTITLDAPDRFATFTCRGIDGTWTGAVDVSKDGLLYVDDLIRDREHSLSPQRMENTYQEYLNKMVDRKNDGAQELMVGTLWNTMDPLERIRKIYKDNPLYHFRKIPALNENDESNFDYAINGFSTRYYREMRERLDDADWQAKFQQAPYVREGLLFPTDELQYFNGILPDGDCRVVTVTDVAWGGGDSLSMPIGVEYDNGNVYIIGWVFNRGPKEVTIPLVVGNIIGYKVRQTRFEGNQGGDLYCQYVDEALQKQGWKCNCTSKKAPNNMEKMSKIIAYSGDIKRKFYFLTPHRLSDAERLKDAELGIKRYVRNKEYDEAMEELTTFVTIGQNPHDDAADGLTQLQMFIEKPVSAKPTRIMHSPI